MPSPYRIRSFIENGYYHVFNRGVEKRNIFMDKEDYWTFYRFLNKAVTPPDPKLSTRRVNFFGKISLACFCFMPNHFHLLIRQKSNLSLDKFMHSLSIIYTNYFNKKYHRVGSLFQGPYLAKLVKNDEYLLHLSRYIHENPKDLGVNPFYYLYSSIQAYLSEKNSWLDKELILALCNNQYKAFISNKTPINKARMQDLILLQD